MGRIAELNDQSGATREHIPDWIVDRGLDCEAQLILDPEQDPKALQVPKGTFHLFIRSGGFAF
jgi:hypothetical protein